MSKFKIVALALAVSIGMAATTINNDRLFEISKNIEIFVNIFKEVNAEYVDDVDPGKIMRIGIDAMLESLDPYTNYISEAQVESYRITTEGKYKGIGAIVKKIGDYVTIIEPYEGSPVLEAGLKAGDQIIEVNGKSTLNKSNDDVTKIMRGVAGTTINLKVKTLGETTSRDITLTRGEVNINNVPYSGMVSDGIGYVALTTFTPNAASNIGNAITKLKTDNELKGLIIDLRDNGGGLLREAVSIVNLFAEKGTTVVSTKGKVKERDINYKTRSEAMDLDIPLVVLINKSSASASEIVSGVLQDLDRAVIMGQRSYGKGLVQNTKEVGYNSRVKITTSKYYIPSGRCIQSIDYAKGEPVDIPDHQRSKFKTKNGRTVLDGGGITPDIKLESADDSEIMNELQKKSIIFQFVNNEFKDKAEIESLEAIDFNDFEKFKLFANSEVENFEIDSQKQLEELREAVEKDGLSAIEADLDILQQKINDQKTKALESNKDVILRKIETEIATRYFYQKGKAYQRLQNDPEVVEAISVLNDYPKYQSILK